MAPLKTTLDYIDVDPNFAPLPKHGHLSRKHAVYAAAEAGIRAGFSALYSQPDFPSFRKLAGDADAVMPPGSPDRYRQVTTELMQFPARDGQLIELKLYKSPDVVPDATLLYRMHGGGWTVGNHEVDGTENVYAALQGNIVVVSVKYRLAPENPFPRPLHDCYDGLLWCKENAKVLGINPEKIILGGSSAGGNLAACLALEARDNGINGIIAQVLHFPITCHPNLFPKDKFEFGSYMQNHDNPVLTSLVMERVLDAYIPDATPDQRHSPVLASSLRDLPPALIAIAGVDVLRDEGFAYAEALEAAGAQVEVHSYKGLPHCFPGILNDIPETKEFYESFTDFLRRHASSFKAVDQYGSGEL